MLGHWQIQVMKIFNWLDTLKFEIKKVNCSITWSQRNISLKKLVLKPFILDFSNFTYIVLLSGHQRLPRFRQDISLVHGKDTSTHHVYRVWSVLTWLVQGMVDIYLTLSGIHDKFFISFTAWRSWNIGEIFQKQWLPNEICGWMYP